MHYIKSDSGLILPKKSGKITTHQNISIASVSKWRKQHATSDLNSSAKDLYYLLQDMHQTSLSPKIRYEILALLQPNLGFLCDGLQKLYYRQEILSENQQAIANLVYGLNIEMLNGYKIVMNDALKTFFVNRKLVLAATANAMHYSVKILFHAFEQHRQPPQDSWLECHRLFAFSKANKIAHKILHHGHSRFKTLEDMYKHCLLFAIANPHRLRKDQLAHLSYAMDAWAPLLVLRQVKNETEPSLFVVDTESDAGPKYSILYPEPTANCYFLVLDTVNQRLMRLLAHMRPTTETKNAVMFSASELALPKPFVETLLHSWQQISERLYQREKVRGFVTVCIGISACYHFIHQLDNGSNIENQNQDDSETPTIEMIDINMLPEETVIPQNKNTEYPAYTCELVDQSEKGFCLKWMHDIPTQLLCGEIIALARESNEQKQWAVGTIRWLKHEEENVLLIGVQLLSQDAIAVKAHVKDSNYGVQTIALSEPQLQQGMSLITPMLPFKTGQEVVLDYQDKSYTANLQKSRSISTSYQEFELDFIDEPLQFPHHSSHLSEKAELASSPNKQ